MRRKLALLGFTTKANIVSKIILLPVLLFLGIYPLITVGAWQATLFALLFLSYIYILPIIRFNSPTIQTLIRESISRTQNKEYVEFLKTFLNKQHYPLSKKELLKYNKK